MKRHEKTLPLLPASNFLTFEMVNAVDVNGGNGWKHLRSKYFGGYFKRQLCRLENCNGTASLWDLMGIFWATGSSTAYFSETLSISCTGLVAFGLETLALVEGLTSLKSKNIKELAFRNLHRLREVM